MNEQKMIDEINRLARLCEAKDAEIKGLMRASHSLREGLEEKLSEAQAQVVMLHNFLYFLRGEFGSISVSDSTNINGIISCADHAYDRITEELSASAETIAAWRAKETEPYKREVAMLRDAIRRVTEANYEQSRYAVTLICQEALNDTQATALAYEREVENRGAVKALEELLDEADDSNWRNAAYSRIEELRADNKGE